MNTIRNATPRQSYRQGASLSLRSNIYVPFYPQKKDIVYEYIAELRQRHNRNILFPLPQSLVTWENDKLVCVQTGEKKNRGWTHWLEGDDLHLVFTSDFY